MPAANTRITITPTSEAHTVLLNYWAGLEGRTLSNLCSSLLENAINEAISKRTVNPQALEMMNEFINVRRNQLKFEYGKTLSLEQEKAENYLSTIADQASSDPDDENKFNQWTSRAEEAWSKPESNSNSSSITEELYKYEPDLDLITRYVNKWNFGSHYVPETTRILTRASMAGIDFNEIDNAINNLNSQFMDDMGNYYDPEGFLKTLEQICKMMIRSKRLSLSKEFPF